MDFQNGVSPEELRANTCNPAKKSMEAACAARCDTKHPEPHTASPIATAGPAGAPAVLRS
jgi:hypothetical protein